MKRITLVLLVLTLNIHFRASSQTVWTFGPMLHYNFGVEKRHFSWALELAYWNIKNVPYSFDGGIEFSKKRTRLYCEVQTGIGFTGVSAGPVIEYNKEERKLRAGYQMTLWMNYFLGFDYRYRRIDKTHFNCIGTYGKLPIATKDMKSSNGKDYHNWDD